MRIFNIINHLEPNKRKALAEMLRFVLVGGTATALQYAIYIVALKVMNHNLALTLGYGISFIFNFFASTYFTFKVKANARRGMGFALSHVVNYFMQLGVFKCLFIYRCTAKTGSFAYVCCVCAHQLYIGSLFLN